MTTYMILLPGITMVPFLKRLLPRSLFHSAEK